VQLVITPAESSRLDMASHVPVDTLMDRAGLAVALAAVRLGAAYGTRVLALAGPGNNGGDAYVAARYLRRRGVAVEIRSLGHPKDGDSPAGRAAATAAEAGVPVKPLGDPEPCDLLVDGLFGAGFRGALEGPATAWVGHPAPVVAVDLPSGLSGADGTVEGAAFTAARTVTFHALKTGHLLGEGPDHCGVVEVADIGLVGGEPALMLCGDEDAPLPERARSAHKWNAGAVLVVGGSPGLLGAAVLAARAALRFGAGYVRLVVPGGLRDVAASIDPSLTTAAVGGAQGFTARDAETILSGGDRFDVLALGPGLGTSRGAPQLVAALLERWDRPVVLDADGISAASVEALRARSHPTIVTPHAGEFARLAGEPAGYEAAARLANRTGTVVVLKGGPTIVAGRDCWAVTSGGPELATLGTGDVLTGMTAALAARGLDPETAARAAAHWHGRAGASLAARETVTASGLADEIARWAW
jgi:NAD(P)H-hydrate epimerase